MILWMTLATLALADEVPATELYVHIEASGPGATTLTMPYGWLGRDLLDAELAARVATLPLARRAKRLRDASPGSRSRIRRGRGDRALAVSLEVRPAHALAWIED